MRQTHIGSVEGFKNLVVIVGGKKAERAAARVNSRKHYPTEERNIEH